MGHSPDGDTTKAIESLPTGSVLGATSPTMRTNTEESAVLVALRGGLAVDWRIVARVLELEDRGIVFVLLETRKFRVRPSDLLTDDDRVFLRTHRDEIQRLLEFDADSQPH